MEFGVAIVVWRSLACSLQICPGAMVKFVTLQVVNGFLSTYLQVDRRRALSIPIDMSGDSQ